MGEDFRYLCMVSLLLTLPDLNIVHFVLAFFIISQFATLFCSAINCLDIKSALSERFSSAHVISIHTSRGLLPMSVCTSTQTKQTLRTLLVCLMMLFREVAEPPTCPCYRPDEVDLDLGLHTGAYKTIAPFLSVRFFCFSSCLSATY